MSHHTGLAQGERVGGLVSRSRRGHSQFIDSGGSSVLDASREPNIGIIVEEVKHLIPTQSMRFHAQGELLNITVHCN